MEFFKYFLENQKKHFVKGGKFEKFYFLFEANESFLYTNGEVTHTAPHVRDAADLKRVMITVVFALIPAVLMALYNTGYQANLALSGMGIVSVEGWRGYILSLLHLPLNPQVFASNIIHGSLYFFPVYIVTLAAGGLWEVIFSTVRNSPLL